jgi:hypothetical protein
LEPAGPQSNVTFFSAPACSTHLFTQKRTETVLAVFVNWVDLPQPNRQIFKHKIFHFLGDNFGLPGSGSGDPF